MTVGTTCLPFRRLFPSLRHGPPRQHSRGSAACIFFENLPERRARAPAIPPALVRRFCAPLVLRERTACLSDQCRLVGLDKAGFSSLPENRPL